MLRSVFILLIVATFLSPAAAQHASISGTVSDSISYELIVGANVSLLNTTIGATTSPEGTFTLVRIPPGEYALRISMVGYATAESTLIVRDGDSLTLHLSLEPEEQEEEEVVVTATRTARHIADVPVRIEAVP